MLFLTESDVRALLPMAEAIRLMRGAFEELASGAAINHPRHRLILPTRSVLHYMVGGEGRYFGAKVYSTNPAHGAHFLFLLYAAEDARLLAVIQANALGQIRTGAASGLATDLMARADASTLGLIGSGFQARAQLEAAAAVRRLEKVRVWSRSPEKRRRFADECGAAFGLSVEAVDTAEQAVRGARILITATSAKDPVLESGWVGEGCHINAMGSNQAKRRELPADLVRRADWIAVDSVEQSRIEAGDLLLALDEDGWRSPRLVELQEVVAGRLQPRTHGREVTIFKSNGLAVEDVAAAGFVYERARESGVGRDVGPAHS